MATAVENSRLVISFVEPEAGRFISFCRVPTDFVFRATRTCLAIGPDDADKIDPVTGRLQLL